MVLCFTTDIKQYNFKNKQHKCVKVAAQDTSTPISLWLFAKQLSEKSCIKTLSTLPFFVRTYNFPVWFWINQAYSKMPIVEMFTYRWCFSRCDRVRSSTRCRSEACLWWPFPVVSRRFVRLLPLCVVRACGGLMSSESAASPSSSSSDKLKEHNKEYRISEAKNLRLY